MPVSQTGN